MESNNKENQEAEVVAEEGNGETPDLKVASADPAQAEIENLKKEILYQRAEFDNYKKRILREQSDSIRLANKGLINEVLNAVDLLDRALAHAGPLKAKGETDVTNFVSGIEMTQNEILQLLGRFGVEFVGIAGEKFDPERHEAISQQDAEGDKVGTVLQVFQRGASLHGKLLKPARVVVGK